MVEKYWVDEKNQVLVTNCWLEHSWVDQRIKWNPEEYNNLQVIRIPAKKLWLPDIVLYNNADDFTNGYMPSNAMVHQDGKIFWSPPSRLQSSCKVDTTYFPFDRQSCPMKFGSWTYDKAQVDIVKSRDHVDMANYITNGEWGLIGSSVFRDEKVYLIGDEIYPDVTVSIIIHRRILYYILNIILPCVWLNMLSLLAFCLPPDAGEKITLGITVLLSYSVFTLLIAESMPPTSEFVPLIGIYLTISMALTAISVILQVCVLKLHHCGPHQTPVPKWMKCLILKHLARIVSCKCHNTKRRPARYLSRKKNSAMSVEENVEMCLRLVNETHVSKRSPVIEFQSPNPRGNQFTTPSGNNLSHNGPYTDMGSHAGDVTAELKRLSVLEEILRYVKMMVAKRDMDDDANALMEEWRELAHVTDRCLFWIFLFITTTATIVIIVLIPLFAAY